MPPPAVAVLTRRLANGEEAAFSEFHALYFDRLHQFLLIVARGREQEAREALQETFIRVARKARPFDDDEAFWCWLKAVARNAARDAGRKQTRYAALLESFSSLLRPAAAPLPRTDSLASVLRDCLSELTTEDRALVEGKYLHGFTVAELARQTGLSDKAIESRLVRARGELKTLALNKLRQP